MSWMTQDFLIICSPNFPEHLSCLASDFPQRHAQLKIIDLVACGITSSSSDRNWGMSSTGTIPQERRYCYSLFLFLVKPEGLYRNTGWLCSLAGIAVIRGSGIVSADVFPV